MDWGIFEETKDTRSGLIRVTGFIATEDHGGLSALAAAGTHVWVTTLMCSHVLASNFPDTTKGWEDRAIRS